MRILWHALFLVGAGCAAPLQKAVSAPSSAQMQAVAIQAQQIADLGRAAKEAAELSCNPILKRETGWDEERAIGQALAIFLAQRSGHFFLDGATEQDPRKLSDALAERRPLTLPEGGKNAVSAHVAIVGKNLARSSSRPDLPWIFGVIENDTPSAFSTPGGYVFVTTGLLKKTANEAQLAGVLAHEIGHVVHKHPLARYVEGKHKQCIAAKYALYLLEHGGPRSPAMDLVAAYARNFDGSLDLDKSDSGFLKFIMQALLMVLQFGNDKEAEFQTDRTALELLSFAGYDAAEYERLLTALGDKGNGVALAHPAAADRVARLVALRQGELKDFATGTAKPSLDAVFAPLGK